MTERALLGHLAANGTPPADGLAVSRLSVGLEASLERFAHETLPFIANGGAELQFICGAYGRGKTHYLKALSHYARERHFVTAYVDCNDNRVAFGSMVETYRAIADGMTPLKDVSFFSNTGITKIIEAQFTGNGIKEQRALIDRVKADRALVADFRNLVRAYCTAAVGGEGDEDLAEALEALLAATPSYRMPFRDLYRRYPDLPRPLGKLVPRNAAIWLRALLSLPQVLGYRGLLVCFDETETILQHSNQRRQIHLANIRTFIDHLAVGAFRGCAVYYAVADDFEEMAKDLGALTQRIERVHVPEVKEDRNPRAVSVYLDELTVPEPHDNRFFETLVQRILDIGRDAGLPPSTLERLIDQFALDLENARETIYEGGVRQFVKDAAAKIMRHL